MTIAAPKTNELPRNVDGLLAAAQSVAGLDDFGDRYFLKGLNVLVNGLEKEAQLNDMGVQINFGGIINLLVNRLRYVRDVKQHPEILAEKIVQPIVILGLPRTGTTKLQRILSADPQIQSMLYWRTINPAPFPGEQPGNPVARIEAALAVEKMLAEQFPGWMARHPTEALEPDEELHLMQGSFECLISWLFARMPSYYNYISQCDQRPMYRHLHAQMQYLQWQDGGGRGRPWVMKTPVHTGSLDVLLETFPDAVLVHCHRDVQKILPSIASLIEQARRISSDHVDTKVLGDEMLDYWGASVDRYLEVRAQLPKDRIMDVQFEEVVGDVVDVIRRIYARAGRELSEEVVEKFKVKERSQPEHHWGKYSYSAADYGYTPEKIDQRFAKYRSQFITVDGVAPSTD
ncbi:MAG: sulfotransferase [Porticoccaceae bacterium]|nr:sulfotransferase [Porticoccaceae bacterium]